MCPTTVRLVGIDTPETYSDNEPYKFGSITDTHCLDNWGRRATEFAKEQLEGQSVMLEIEHLAGTRGV